jgi:hypothetical protein
MAPVIRAWLGAFLFTQAVEVPIWAHGLRHHRTVRAGGEAWPLWVNFAVAFGASAITHPCVWFLIPRWAPGGYLAMVIQAEAFAVVVEALYMDSFGLRRPLLWSLGANGASAGLGLLSRALFGWP